MKYSNTNVESIKNTKIERLIQVFNADPSKKNFYQVLSLLYAAFEIDEKFVQPYIKEQDDLNPDKPEISFTGVPYAVSAANPDADKNMHFAEIYTSLDKCKNIAVGEFVEYAAVSIRDFFSNVLADDNLDGIVINMGTDEFTLTKSEMQEVIAMQTLKNNSIIEEAISDYNKINSEDNLDGVCYNIHLAGRTGGCFLVPVRKDKDGNTYFTYSKFISMKDGRKVHFVNVYTNHDHYFNDAEKFPKISIKKNVSLEYFDIKEIVLKVFNGEHWKGIVINHSSRTNFLLLKDHLEDILYYFEEDEAELNKTHDKNDRAGWDVHHEELEKLIAAYNKNPVSENRQKVIDCLKYEEMELFISPFIYKYGTRRIPTLERDNISFALLFSNYDEYLNWNTKDNISMAGVDIQQCFRDNYGFDPEFCHFVINPYGENPFFIYVKDVEYILFDN